MLLRQLILSSLLLLPALLLSNTAQAERLTTREALSRLEETLQNRTDDGLLNPSEILPAMVVSVRPIFQESLGWYPTAAIVSLTRVFKSRGLRICEACMAPRTFVERGRLEQSQGVIGLEEIVRLDESMRGTSQPARSAIWLNEHESGVALRVVDLRNGRIILAENFDPELREITDSKRLSNLSRELERRARGDSITQIFADFAVYPGQHISADWTEQWGDSNSNISGITISMWDPLLGLGVNYYRVMDTYPVLVGGQFLISLPTALVQGMTRGNGEEVVDPLFTGVGVIRVPFGKSNYGAVLTLSTNGNVGIGLSFMNFSFLPVLP
ncbi:hypothetical protein KAI87_02770 [Myxococcota bacterium]|nr:hypothetical protein [Myxococcota bacterium]